METLEQIREQNRWNPEKTEKLKTKEPKTIIPYSTSIYMLLTAGFFDALQAILTLVGIGVIASPIITVFAGLTFWFWFRTYGVSFMSWKRILALAGGGVVEMIPVVNILPFWTGYVWYIIETTKISEVASKIPGGDLINKAIKPK
ncbi:MAG: hypothetical protein ACYCZW_01965 [Minisyncoccota bacterium]